MVDQCCLHCRCCIILHQGILESVDKDVVRKGAKGKVRQKHRAIVDCIAWSITASVLCMHNCGWCGYCQFHQKQLRAITVDPLDVLTPLLAHSVVSHRVPGSEMVTLAAPSDPYHVSRMMYATALQGCCDQEPQWLHPQGSSKPAATVSMHC